MANLKTDLLNELRNQKYYAEMELLRLAQEPSIKYRDKIEAIDEQLGQIALINQKTALAEGYFQTTEQQVSNIPEQPENENKVVKEPKPMEQPTQPLPGQSHAE